jgi:hypothetical protein
MKQSLPTLNSFLVLLSIILVFSQKASAQAKVQSTSGVYIPASGSSGFEADVTIKYKFMNMYGDFYVALDGEASHRGNGTYWYKGTAYNSHTVPALSEVFDRTKLTDPTITVDIYKGNAYLATFSHKVTFGIGGALGEGRTLTNMVGKVSESDLGQYSLRNLKVTEISDVSAAIGWMEAQDAINEHNLVAKYDAKIQEANSLYAAKEYEKARQAYKEALSMGLDDSRPNDRVKEINEILKKQESDKKYAEIINEADALLSQGKYSEARNAYSNAASYTTEKSYIEQQLAKIEELIASSNKSEGLDDSEKGLNQETATTQAGSSATSSSDRYKLQAGKGDQQNAATVDYMAEYKRLVTDANEEYLKSMKPAQSSSSSTNPLEGGSSSSASSDEAFTEMGSSAVNLIGGLIEGAQKQKALKQRQEKMRQEYYAKEEAKRLDKERQKIEAIKKHESLVKFRYDVLGKLKEGSIPLSSHNVASDKIYYFFYAYDKSTLQSDNPVVYLSNVFEIGKYSDGTWPFKSAIISEIQALTPQTAIMHGYYTLQREAEQMHQTFKEALFQAKFSISPVAYEGKRTKGITADSTLSFGQNYTLDKIKYEEAEEAFDNSNYPFTLAKLDEAEQMLGETNPRILYLRIFAYYNIIKQDDGSDYRMVATAINDVHSYLNEYANISALEDKYNELVSISLELEKYPKTAQEYEAKELRKKQQLEDKLNEQRIAEDARRKANEDYLKAQRQAEIEGIDRGILSYQEYLTEAKKVRRRKLIVNSALLGAGLGVVKYGVDFIENEKLKGNTEYYKYDFIYLGGGAIATIGLLSLGLNTLLGYEVKDYKREIKDLEAKKSQLTFTPIYNYQNRSAGLSLSLKF